MKLYLAMIRTSFRNELVYKVSVIANTASVLMTCTALYFLWTTIYGGASSYINVSITYMITYAIIGVLINSYQGENVGIYMNSLVRSGEITNYFLKPVHFISLFLCRCLGQTVAKLITTTLISTLVCFFMIGLKSPPTIYHLLGFLLSLLLSYLISFFVLYFIGLLSFFFTEIWGFEFARFAIISLFAGSLIPWWFFPTYMQPFIKYSLFNCMIGIPSSIFIGKFEMSEIGLGLFFQIAWVLFLLFITSVLFKKASTKIMLFGG